MESWPKGVYAITLFVEDLEAAKEFYEEVFRLQIDFEDGDFVLRVHAEVSGQQHEYREGIIGNGDRPTGEAGSVVPTAGRVRTARPALLIVGNV